MSQLAEKLIESAKTTTPVDLSSSTLTVELIQNSATKVNATIDTTVVNAAADVISKGNDLIEKLTTTQGNAQQALTAENF